MVISGQHGGGGGGGGSAVKTEALQLASRQSLEMYVRAPSFCVNTLTEIRLDMNQTIRFGIWEIIQHPSCLLFSPPVNAEC